MVTPDGVAWLSGMTASAAQREEAVRLTKEMYGVSHVVNRIEVAGAPVVTTPSWNACATALPLSVAQMDAPTSAPLDAR